MTNVKYHVKLSRDFFKKDEIVIMINTPGGDFYLRLYLELLTMTVNSDGYLRSKGIFEKVEEELAVIFNVNRDTIYMAFSLFRNLKLLEDKENGEYFFRDALDLRYEG